MKLNHLHSNGRLIEVVPPLPKGLVGLLRKAEGDYKEAMKAYDKAHSAENDAFWEHNQASYRKGIMDAYRSLLGRPEKPDSAGYNIGNDKT